MASLDTTRSDATDGEGDDDEEPVVKAKPVRASLQTAAIPVAPAKEEKASRGNTSSHWGVQVGAFSSKAAGNKAVSQAVKQAPFLLRTAKPSIVQAKTGKETVHTFGWYLRSYIADIRAKGATPVLCTLVPRNNWTNGKITRTPDTHADWTRAVGKAENVGVVDLNEAIAVRYDALGQEATTALFADKTTHTTWAGAELSAQVVVEGLRALPKNPVAAFLRPGM